MPANSRISQLPMREDVLQTSVLDMATRFGYAPPTSAPPSWAPAG
jgi:hypothetical protein